MLLKAARISCRFTGLLALLGMLAFGAGSASAQVQATFYTATAPHAALGAPFQYSLVVTNNGSTSVTVAQTVKLIAPDSTSYSVLNVAKQTINAGATVTTTKGVTSSTFTNQIGAFQLVGTVTQSSTVLFTQTIPITITAAPTNGVYASIGGIGPANALFGTPATHRLLVANLGTSSVTYKKNLYLIMPDGTQQTKSIGNALTLAAGSNTTNDTVTNPSVWSTALPGNYSVLFNVVDSNNNVLASDTVSVVRNALPASMYSPTFTDKTSAAGINVMRMAMTVPAACNSGASADYMPGGSGMAIGDFDGDGYDDIYVVDMMGMGMLYHNNHDGTFTDQTAAAGIPMVMMQTGAIWGDIDNDGRPDLLILTNPMQGTAMPVLLHNNGPNASGQVTFTDISAASGIPAGISAQNLQSATFGDYDGDGLLDLYITAHVDCNGKNDNGHLFHNNGNLTFTDRTDLLGGSTASQVNRRGMVTVFLDYNKDGRPDLYVGNDEGGTYGANVLWRNDGPGGTGGWIFTDVSSASNAGQAMSAMGLAISDFNRDGNFDIFATNTGSNILLQGQSTGVFKSNASDSTGAHVARAGIPKGTTGLTSAITWGAGFYDFNNKGWEDLFVASGPIATGSGFFNAFFLNNQDGTFLDISNLTGTLGGGADLMPAAVFADFNNDGFMDILTFGMTSSSAHLYMNNARSNGNTNNWLQVKLVGGCMSATGCAGLTNHDAINARLVATVGSANLWRQVFVGAGSGGNSTLVQQLGLGTATQVDSLTVYWPSGKTTTMTNIPANQKITITEM